MHHSPRRESTLLCLAILKTNWDKRGQDYVEIFVPFVVECLHEADDDIISLPVLRAQMEEKFGLKIPLNPLQNILRRTAKQGFLSKSHGVYYRVRERCAASPFSSLRAGVLEAYEFLVRELQSFVENRFDTSWSREEADKHLADFLRNNTLALAFDLAERRDVVGDKNSSNAYIVAAFMRTSSESKQLANALDLVAKGNLLAASIHYPNLGRIQKRFSNTRIYLDTSVIVYAAGFAGPERARAPLEMIELLLRYGGNIYCLKATIDEIRGILDACANRLKTKQFRDSYGPSMEYFIETGKSASDVELMAARLTSHLNELKIEVDELPPYEREYTIDETGLESELQRNIGYKNPKACQHDVDCISAIARLRRGRETFEPESCIALFITSNSELARVTRKFFQSDSTPGVISLCMTDFALGNLLWLKNPAAAPELPLNRVIADAYAAIQPSEDLWKSYLIQIAQLQEDGKISENEYLLLRYSLSAKAHLMEHTKGEPGAFTEGTVRELLTIAKDAIRGEAEQRERNARNAQEEAEKALAIERARRSKQTASLERRAETIAKWIVRAIYSVVLVALVLALTYSMPWNLPNPVNEWLKYVVAASSFVLLLSSLLNLLFGTTLKRLAERLRTTLSGRFFRVLAEFFGFED